MKAQEANSQPKVEDQDSNSASLILEQVALTIVLHSLHFGVYSTEWVSWFKAIFASLVSASLDKFTYCFS